MAELLRSLLTFFVAAVSPPPAFCLLSCRNVPCQDGHSILSPRQRLDARAAGLGSISRCIFAERISNRKFQIQPQPRTGQRLMCPGIKAGKRRALRRGQFSTLRFFIWGCSPGFLMTGMHCRSDHSSNGKAADRDPGGSCCHRLLYGVLSGVQRLNGRSGELASPCSSLMAG